MLHFEAVIGKVVMSTFFLCVLTTLWMTIVCLTHLSVILCSRAHFSQILDLCNFLYHLEDELVGFNVISCPWLPLQLLQLFLNFFVRYVELASVRKKKNVNSCYVWLNLLIVFVLETNFCFFGSIIILTHLISCLCVYSE